MDDLPAIKLPVRQTAQARVVPPERARARQPYPTPASREKTRQTAEETIEQARAYPQDTSAVSHRSVTEEGTKERSLLRSFERTRTRHTFDIFKDQLLSLKKIATEREEKFGMRVLLGELVQEALDRFITKERNQQ